jgi:hypothetical protein
VAAGDLGSKQASEPGLLFYLMVNSAAATIERFRMQETVQPMGADALEITEYPKPGGKRHGLVPETA